MFQHNLKKLRESKGLTYRELSDVLSKKYDVKFSKSTIERWEKGESSPTITHASAIAHYFDVTLDELSGIKEMPKMSNEVPKYNTIAAHIDDNVTEEELKDIADYIEFRKRNRK